MSRRKKVVRRRSKIRDQSAQKRATLPTAWVWQRKICIFVFLAVLAILSMLSILKFYDHSALDGLQAGGRSKVLTNIIVSYLILGGSIGYLMLRWFSTRAGTVHRTDWIVLILSFLAVTLLYVGSFNPMLSPNGDNAEYILTAKSLLERGGAYRLYTPNETPNRLASLGLPLMLTPIYLQWGLDLFKMKVLIMSLGVGLFPLVFILLRQFYDFSYSAVLTIVISTSPYLVSLSTQIMTEIPYVFLTILAILASQKYLNGSDFKGMTAIYLLILILAAYLTRITGITLIVALVFTALAKVLFARRLGATEEQFAARNTLRKMVVFAIPIAIAFLIIQMRSADNGVSQIEVLWRGDLLKYFHDNLVAASRVLGQMLGSEEIFRWWNFSEDANLPPTSALWSGIMLVILLGIFRAFPRLSIMSTYMIFLMLAILQASRTPQEMVIIRYFTVIIPFMLCFFAEGLIYLGKRMSLVPFLRKVVDHRLAVCLGMVCLFAVNMQGNLENLAKAEHGYGPHYESYILASKWCGEHLPEDAYIMTAKPRITYLYSSRKATRLTKFRETQTPTSELEKIEEMRNMGITHLIVDALSHGTKEIIYPMLKNHPDLFEAYDIPALAGRCTVLKFKG